MSPVWKRTVYTTAMPRSWPEKSNLEGRYIIKEDTHSSGGQVSWRTSTEFCFRVETEIASSTVIEQNDHNNMFFFKGLLNLQAALKFYNNNNIAD